MIPFVFVVILCAMCQAEDYYYTPPNITRSTLNGIEEYRSALTLHWLAAEDQRQRELAAAFETDTPPSIRSMASDCISYAKPASGKIARLMMELLKSLEGDNSNVITSMIQALARAKLLVETAMLDAEPDLDALVKTPDVMMGEPHTTFPRILAMTWIAITDPVTTKKFGWCPIVKVNKYLSVTKPVTIAKQMRALELIIAQARFIMEEFIQHVTPINVYQKQPSTVSKVSPPVRTETHRRTPKRPFTPPSRTSAQTFQTMPLQEEEDVSTTPFEEFIPDELISNTLSTEGNIIVAVRSNKPSSSSIINLPSALFVFFLECAVFMN